MCQQSQFTPICLNWAPVSTCLLQCLQDKVPQVPTAKKPCPALVEFWEEGPGCSTALTLCVREATEQGGNGQVYTPPHTLLPALCQCSLCRRGGDRVTSAKHSNPVAK